MRLDSMEGELDFYELARQRACAWKQEVQKIN